MTHEELTQVVEAIAQAPLPTISFESVIRILPKMRLRHPKDTMPVNFDYGQLCEGLYHVRI